MSQYMFFYKEEVFIKHTNLTLGRAFVQGGCSKLTTSLVNVSLNFQKLISQICQYFLLKKCEKLLYLDVKS